MKRKTSFFRCVWVKCATGFKEVHFISLCVFNVDVLFCVCSAGGNLQVRHSGDQPQTSSEETPAAERPGESSELKTHSASQEASFCANSSTQWGIKSLQCVQQKQTYCNIQTADSKITAKVD